MNDLFGLLKNFSRTNKQSYTFEHRLHNIQPDQPNFYVLLFQWLQPPPQTLSRLDPYLQDNRAMLHEY